MRISDWSSDVCSSDLEAYAVGRAKGVNFSFDDPIAYIRAFGGSIPNGKPSLLLDLLEGRPCEIDFINGGVCRVGREVGVPTPANDLVVALVKAKEKGLLAARKN